MEKPTYARGLEGVIAAESKICRIELAYYRNGGLLHTVLRWLADQ